MLESLFIKNLLKKGIFSLINSADLLKEKLKIMKTANHTFMANGDYIRLLHEGESSCLALFNLLDFEKKAIVIDERTTRMLCESPENLKKLLESKLHTKIGAHEKNYSIFRNFKIIRSSELNLLAYKSGIINLPAKKQDAIEALLYALKYKGCTISREEIDEAVEIM
jgi:hypothetical protein